MKVQLIVVQGKPEGKVIPLAGPIFKIGRGETCHLKPNSELVSREHAEFTITGEAVTVRDLGSRNGTLVNGKMLKAAFVLKNGDLVQVGPLTFAVSIQGAPAAAAPKPAPPDAVRKPAASLDDNAGNEEIEQWLVADEANPTPERPSGVYGGDTITITAFKDQAKEKKDAAPAKPEPAAAAPAPPPEVDDNEYERQAEEEEPEAEEAEAEGEAEEDAAPEEWVDESNPFYAAKKQQKKEPDTPAAPTKPAFQDTSAAASEILRKMMERRRANK